MAGNNTLVSGGTAFSKGGIETVDLIVIIIYLILCMATGLWATWRANRGSVRGYFLAGRDILWFAVGASLFSSNIGSGSFVGLAGTGAASGIAVASYELNGLYCLLLLAWLFVPVYIASGVYTMPEYLMKRFGGQRLQVYMAVLSLIIYIFTKISADIYAGAIFIQQSLQWNMYLAIAVLLAITAVYTVTGGLKAVIYTDTLQTVIMVAGAVILMIISFIKVGGLGPLHDKYLRSIPTRLPPNSTCGLPNPEAFHLLQPADSNDLPWPGNIFGITILSSWYFCNDQVLVQRTLAAKNMLHVKGGAILAAYLKVLPLFIIVFPGMISRVLFPDEVGCGDPAVCKRVCENEAGCTNIAYPKLVIELMPPGLKGLMLAAMMAALMSSLTSVFNSSATIFTIDIWRKLRPTSTEAEMLIVGRVFVLVLIGLSIVWVPVLELSQGGQLFNYIQSVTGYFAPPILALFLLAILWHRINEQGAFWGLMVGLAIGIVRMGLDFGYGSPACGEEDTRPAVIAKIHFLHFTIILFVITLITIVIVSLLTPPIDVKHMERLTWHTRHSKAEREEFPEEKERHLKVMVAMEIAKNAKPHRAVSTVPRWKRYLQTVCGYEPPAIVDLSEEEADDVKKAMTSGQESKNWRIFVDFNAVILMCFGAFLWGFFG